MITLSKHHGLGNDFLVTADPVRDPAAAARAWCDRRRGIGADGLLLLGAGPASGELTMILHNADGSRAEMSGNGIRCLAQAASRAAGASGAAGALDGIGYRVHTDAGVRQVHVTPGASADDVWVEVGMGPVTPITPPEGWDGLGVDPLRPTAHLSLGNPHSVVAVDDVAVVDLARLGSVVPQTNLEIVEPGPGPAGITMRVHERGAGLTEACGTGACASAFAAARWGLVGSDESEITVHMPGGHARVRLDSPAPGEVTLIGPATYIATITLSW